MMYHLKFSLTGGASCSVGCSPSGFCAAVFSCSTAMCMPFGASVSVLNDRSCLVLRKVGDQPREALADNKVDDLKVGREDEHRRDYDDRGCLYFLLGRRDNLAHL